MPPPPQASSEPPRNGAERDSANVASQIVIKTPPSWKVLSVEELAERAERSSDMREQLRALDENAEQTVMALAAFAAAANKDLGVLFSTISIPGEDGSIDLTVFTIALPQVGMTPKASAETAEGSAATASQASEPLPVTEPGREQNAVLLPAGPAARSERCGLIDLGQPLPALPVHCIEYAVQVPNTENVAMLTFTTVAPSDPDVLRDQFSDIATTLRFV